MQDATVRKVSSYKLKRATRPRARRPIGRPAEVRICCRGQRGILNSAFSWRNAVSELAYGAVAAGTRRVKRIELHVYSQTPPPPAGDLFNTYIWVLGTCWRRG
jgi:hypothetical protein